MRILVIDDEPDVTSLVAVALETDDGKRVVAQCNDPSTALDRISSDAPDLVLLDIAMPRMEGFAILEELRREGNEVP